MRVSPTKLATFQRCPQQYAFQYVQRIPRAPTAAMTFGSNLHRTLQTLYEQGGPQTETAEQVKARLQASWSGHGFASPTEEAAYKALGETIVSQFHGQYQIEEGTPLLIEKRLEAPYEDVRFFGIVDRVDLMPDATLNVIDYKSTRYIATDVSEVNDELMQQLSLYAYMAKVHLPYPVRRLSIHYLRTNERLSFPPEAMGEGWLERAYAAAQAMVAAHETERFPAQLGDHCRWCPYTSRCRAYRAHTHPVL
ncbi:MAG: PD-(D/E)XK nuclease family protein [Candidatus Sericytochromatia bacterium]|nr:PD-(D/E)XK nuclease family protein [Candidatus Sericytochromatia bacterium]